MNTVDTGGVNKYGSTYKQLSTKNNPSITDMFTKVKLPSIQVNEEYRENTIWRQTSISIIANDKKPAESTKNFTKEIESTKNTGQYTKDISRQANISAVSEDNKEYEAYTTGRQTSVSITQDITNDKKPTVSNINTVKVANSIRNTDFAITENMQSIKWTNDKIDKMTSSTNDNGEYQMNTKTYISNAKTDNLQTKFIQEILKTSVETEVQNFNSDSDSISTSIIRDMSKGVEYTTTLYHTEEKNTGNQDLHKTLTTLHSNTRTPVVSTKVFSQGTRLGISSSGEYVDKQTLDVTNQGKESKPT